MIGPAKRSLPQALAALVAKFESARGSMALHSRPWGLWEQYKLTVILKIGGSRGVLWITLTLSFQLSLTDGTWFKAMQPIRGRDILDDVTTPLYLPAAPATDLQ